MPVSTARIRNDMLKSAVITDTKFYFPSFFEQNQQQRGGAEKEAFRHLFRSRVERIDEVKFDFLPSCANIDVSRTLSVPSGERERKVKGRRRKAVRQCFILTCRVFTNFWHGKYLHCILFSFARSLESQDRRVCLRVCETQILRDAALKMKVAHIVVPYKEFISTQLYVIGVFMKNKLQNVIRS